MGRIITRCHEHEPVAAADASKKFDRNSEAALGMPIILYNTWKVHTVYRSVTDLAVVTTTAAGGIG